MTTPRLASTSSLLFASQKPTSQEFCVLIRFAFLLAVVLIPIELVLETVQILQPVQPVVIMEVVPTVTVSLPPAPAPQPTTAGNGGSGSHAGKGSLGTAPRYGTASRGTGIYRSAASRGAVPRMTPPAGSRHF